MIPREQIQALSNKNDAPCVSIFIPTVKAGKETQQNMIRFKNELKKAEKLLEERRIDKNTVHTILNRAYELVDDSLFWQQTDKGLAAFLSIHTTQFFRVPIPLQEDTVVANNFFIKPLLPLYAHNGEYYILNLNIEYIELFSADKYTIRKITLPDVPVGIEDYLQFEDQERQKQTHTRRPEKSGNRQAIFHGHGVGTDGNDDKKEQISRFFNKIDHALTKSIGKDQKPLILIGNKYLHPIYKDISAYQNIVSHGVYIDTGSLDRSELHEKAWNTIQPYFIKPMLELKEQAVANRSTDEVSNDIAHIVKASGNGRVETLFLCKEKHLWGHYSIETDTVTVHDSSAPGDEDLLNLAAINTLQHGSENIYVLPRGEMPEPTSVATALLRF